MITDIDLRKLREISITDVAEACNLEVKRWKSLCPFHSDTIPSLTFNRRKNTYRCFVCSASGGPIDLVAHMMNLKFRDACHWLACTFGIVLEDKCDHQFANIQPRKVRPTRTLRDEEPKVDIRHLSMLVAQPVLNADAKRFLFDERKLSPEIIEQLGISSISCPVPMSGNLNGSWFNAPSLLIPYKDVDGRLVSVQARYLGSRDSLNSTPYTLNQKPRFQFPKGSKCNIFNLDVLKTLKEKEPLFITEGVTDCLALLSAGFKAIAIPSATLLKPQDVKLLGTWNLKLGTTFHMYPDRDAPGERLYLDLKEMLEIPSSLNPQPSTLIRHQLPEGFKDVGQYYAFIHKDDSINYKP